MRSLMNFGRSAALLATALLVACAHNGGWEEAAKPGDFPCLSYDKPCGKIAVRPPVAKSLEGPLNGSAERGKQLAFARNQGNCLACHAMQGGMQMGTRGPDLTRYGALGRSDAETFALIYDMRTRVPEALMPPIGTNGILSEQQIRDVVAFLQSSR